MDPPPASSAARGPSIGEATSAEPTNATHQGEALGHAASSGTQHVPDVHREELLQRGYSEQTVANLIETQRCEQCNDQLGEPRHDDCECPCHCACCCDGFFRCLGDCNCTCACHYDPDTPDQPVGEIVAETPTIDDKNPATPTAAMATNEPATLPIREPAQGQHHPTMVGSGEANGKQEDTGKNANDDVDMGGDSAPTPKLAQLSYVQYYEQLQRHRIAMDDSTQPSYTPEEIAGAYFAKLYVEQISTGQKSKEGTNFPETTTKQRALIWKYLTVLLDKDYAQPRFHGFVKVVVMAILRSSWSFEKVFENRITTASTATAPVTNVWNTNQQATTAAKTALTTDMETFRFDPQVFADERIEQLRAICQAPLPFAETCRPPTDDEWCILLGIMSGTILIRAMPQFIKRCCTLEQMNWFHQQMILQAEGELLITIPNQAFYDFNQSSRRLAEKLRHDAAFQGWTDPEFEKMIMATKAITYNAEIKALHFHFFTKKEAVTWEGMEIPVGTKQAKLVNPDAKYRTVKTAADGTQELVFQAPKDGLVDDRYQGQYKFLVTNVTRTMEIDKLAKYLQLKTSNAIKMSMPMDSYGPSSESSLLWEFYAHKTTCPPELAKINRIMWREHALLVIHAPGRRNAPCHQCARIGHEATACKVPQANWYDDHTLLVKDDEIRRITTERAMWRTPEEAKETFAALAAPPGAQAEKVPATATREPGQPEQARPHEPESSNVPPERGGAATTTSTTNDGTATLTTTTTTHNGADTQTTTKKTHEADTQATMRTSAPSNEHETTSTATGQTPPEPAQTKPTPPAEPNPNDWITAVATFTQRRTNKSNKKKQTAEQITKRNGPTKASTTPTGNKFSSLSHQDESDDEADDAPAPTTNDGGPKPAANAPPTNRKNRDSKPYAKAEDADSVTAAVHRADLERLGLAITAKATHGGRAVDHTTIVSQMDTALTHATATASKAWVLNALSGKSGATPDTGNCQFYALVEALLQQAIKTATNPDTHIELTTLLKYGIFHATTVDTDLERTQANPAAILDFAEGAAAERTQAELDTAMANYYQGIATSSSELSHLLPKTLWGGTDTLRMAAKVLRRTIHIISDTTDPTQVSLTMIHPQRLRHVPSRTQFYSATVAQPGMQQWFASVRDDLQHRHTPIILHYTGMHFNSILLQSTNTDDTRSIAKKNTKMTDHWKQVEGEIERATTSASPTGPTRLELASSQSSVTASEILRALTQANWNRHEKKAAIDAMILDPPRLKELLAFTATADGDSDAEMAQADDEAHVQLAQSTLAPSPSDTSDAASGSQYTPSDSTSSSQAQQFHDLSGPNAAEGQYDTWSQLEWERVVQQWAEQSGEILPTLHDHSAMAKFAATKPELMTELARWFANPFVLLDHFTDDAIKGWMAAKRMRYCLRHLKLIVDTIESPSHQAVLTDWLSAINNADSTTHKTSAYRDSTKWSTLREVAGPWLKGPTAVPFLSINFAKEFAFVLVLDDLIPSLGRHILHHEGRPQTGTVELPYVYRESPGFRQALAAAQAASSWGPVADYIQSLTIEPAPPASRC